MRFNFNHWSDYHHQIYRIYHAIIALSLVPFFFVFLELEVTSIKEPRVADSIVWILLLVLIPLGVYMCWDVWKGRRFQIAVDREMPLKSKLLLFRKMEVRKFWWLELVCVVALLGLWLTAHYLFVILYFAVLAQFSFLRPSEDRLIRVLRLTKEERVRLHQEDFGQ